MRTLALALLSAAALTPLPHRAAAQAVDTHIVVRAVANDAKIIGSHVGGARITIRDLATGRVLATGVQEGSTGNTDLIMSRPRERGATVFDTPGAAGFQATLSLAAPTRVEITAEGPLGNPQALQRASTTLLLVPGRDYTGEGVVLMLDGLAVAIDSGLTRAAAGDTLDVRVTITMLCGCPTQPGGMWDADSISATARLLQGGRVAAESPVAYAGTTSTYLAHLVPPAPGDYDLQIVAVDARRANAGMATRRLHVERRR